eukprot:CAMPEP_0182922166 /NCGR_PEP_ID=MMETSP0105_2-20130417/4623_1 /TAXON_ID=81532 ORGANISM="Acanthoeca-like sp., Strain 10tr" /NCGR_SAMPLE_ID=MMETSP0105_2 /ASSEMBLY_ACC=CAM_ASM_000205 /LENGTH=604 /DNA_ID=CAMNT_0025059763 /DNA_START=137 /DNA_END=1951 /DNA_ORIENTATION=+
MAAAAAAPHNGLKKGDVVAAMYGHEGEANDKDELTFEEGDLFCLLKAPTDEAWWYVQQVGGKRKKGYVPSNCVIPEGSLDRHEWCHGAINRSAAEFLLVKNGTNGAFLVRESQSKPGEYTLSLFDSQVAHYRINQHPDGTCFIRAKQIFTSIPELIEHHKQRTSGLPVILSYCIPKAGKRAVVISKKLEEAWELPRKDVKMGKMLGAGNYGEVYKAIYSTGRTKMTVAVKTLKEEDSMGIEEFMQEAQVMKKLKHPNLVTLIGVCSTDMPMLIVTEFVPNGDMLTYLRQPKAKKEMTQVAMLYVCAQVADGMAYLELHNCIHRDLAARNCLVADDLVIKIADFGMGRVIDDLYTARTGSKMPVKWSAPESLCYNAFSNKSDVWSYGILMWEVVTIGDNPYPEIDSKDVLMKLEEGYRMREPAGCPSGLYPLMIQAWMMRADDRPTFAQLKVAIGDLYEEARGGEQPPSPPDRPAPMERKDSWRDNYEKKSADGLTPMTMQEIIDATKVCYGLASTLVRYADDRNVKQQLESLLSSMDALIKMLSPMAKQGAVKPHLKVFTSARTPLLKMAPKPVLSKVRPYVEKIRGAVRELNRVLKQLKSNMT